MINPEPVGLTDIRKQLSVQIATTKSCFTGLCNKLVGLPLYVGAFWDCLIKVYFLEPCAHPPAKAHLE